MLMQLCRRSGDLPGWLLARLRQCLPSSCALCGACGDAALCDACCAQFFGQRRQRCVQCATPLPAAPVAEAGRPARCGDCLRQPPAFDATFVAADYQPPIDQLVLALKFGGQLALAPLFAALVHETLLRDNFDRRALPDVLTAVPLGPQRLAGRGFNQGLEIARPLARHLGIPLDARLTTRLRDTQAQATLHPDQRRKNIRNVFMVSGHAIERIHGRHVGVVDDVITTGETLNELAATLKRFGAARVSNFVFARTLPH